MFRSQQDYRSFLTLLITYTLDLVGYSIVFPVLAPLLLNPNLHYFPSDTPESVRTTMLGILFAAFGVSQFFGAPMTGALADHYGRYKVFLGSIGLSVIGYCVMAWGLYIQSISWLFVGRIFTGLCSGNCALAQSATADLTEIQHRSKAFGILLGVGGLGFIAGPWIGGKLANPLWLSGSGAFIFAAIAALINWVIVYFFFAETLRPSSAENFTFNAFKKMRLVFHEKNLRIILMTYLFFAIGWGLFLIFSPTFLVQRFALGSDKIGYLFAYMAMIRFFCSTFLNKELASKFSIRKLILMGNTTGAVGVLLFLTPGEPWAYWFIIPIALAGGALSWINLGAILSINAPESMQGRVLGVSGSIWSIAQIVAALVAGFLAGWNIYSSLLLGALFLILSFVYFLVRYQEQ